MSGEINKRDLLELFEKNAVDLEVDENVFNLDELQGNLATKSKGKTQEEMAMQAAGDNPELGELLRDLLKDKILEENAAKKREDKLSRIDFTVVNIGEDTKKDKDKEKAEEEKEEDDRDDQEGPIM